MPNLGAMMEKVGTAPNSSATLLLIRNSSEVPGDAAGLLADLVTEFRIGITEALPENPQALRKGVDALAEELGRSDVKRPTVIGIGEGAKAAQFLAIYHPKMVRRLVLVDAITRAEPSLKDRVLEGFTYVLPAGLPLETAAESFDSRSMLHRVTCPTLVISSPGAGTYQRHEWQFIGERIPNCWRHLLEKPYLDSANGAPRLNGEFTHLIHSFSQMAVKRPQKNLKADRKEPQPVLQQVNE